ATRPINPSRASISRTRCPLPSPPMAGLQDISPIVLRLWVSSSVRAPARTAAAAASHPAWPPPITITSNWASNRMGSLILFHVKNSLSDAEIPEYHIEKLVEIDRAGDSPDLAHCATQLFGRT